jgi:CHAD domain-containing protein
MAYRLRNDESIRKGLERLVTHELRSAVDQLAEPESAEQAIHEARKSIKKVRAALQLIRKRAPDVTRGHRNRLRRSGHLLSPVRDTDALLQTARDLCDEDAGAQDEPLCAALHRHLAANKARAFQPSALGRTRRQALEDLRAIHRSARHWDLRAVRFPVIAKGLKRVYRDAREAMPGARQRNDDEALHRWRRRVKTLWYNLRLFEERMPGVTGLTDDLGHLETWLGEDHNLALLREQINRMPSQEPSMRARLTGLADRRQQERRRASLALGARVFARKPRELFEDLYLWRRASNLVRPRRTFKAVRSGGGRTTRRTRRPRRSVLVVRGAA